MSAVGFDEPGDGFLADGDLGGSTEVDLEDTDDVDILVGEQAAGVRLGGQGSGGVGRLLRGEVWFWRLLEGDLGLDDVEQAHGLGGLVVVEQFEELLLGQCVAALADEPSAEREVSVGHLGLQ